MRAIIIRGAIIALAVLVGCSSTVVTVCAGDQRHSPTTTCTTQRD